MQRKVFLQIFLFTVVLGMIFVFYKIYFVDEKLVTPIQNIENKKIIQNKQEDSNLIYNIEYVAEDKKGSKYLIKSDYGSLSTEQSNLITLQQVSAVITLENTPPISIFSDSALYNSTSYNTEFYGNVIVTYIDHNITSDNLNLYFENNLADILNNVVYKNLNTTLEADKIELDLLTKNSNVYMNNKFEKIKITNKK
jgi:lipopolysaccharide export system protein LptA